MSIPSVSPSPGTPSPTDPSNPSTGGSGKEAIQKQIDDEKKKVDANVDLLKKLYEQLAAMAP